MEGRAEGAVHGGALTTADASRIENHIEQSATFGFDCQACSRGRFLFLGIVKGAQGSRYVRSECVDCGAVVEKPLTPALGGSR